MPDLVVDFGSCGQWGKIIGIVFPSASKCVLMSRLGKVFGGI